MQKAASMLNKRCFLKRPNGTPEGLLKQADINLLVGMVGRAHHWPAGYTLKAQLSGDCAKFVNSSGVTKRSTAK
ncbi:MAG: hypothetical protein ACJA0N_001559 [Pseudohongiellaceae bacterium]|jgi:hypothetical protein